MCAALSVEEIGLFNQRLTVTFKELRSHFWMFYHPIPLACLQKTGIVLAELLGSSQFSVDSLGSWNTPMIIL